MLKQRIITGVVLVLALLASVYFLSTEVFALLTLAVIGIGAWEWARLSGLQNLPLRVGYLLMVVALAALAWWHTDRHDSMLAVFTGVGWWVVVLVILAVYHPQSEFRQGWRLLLRLAGIFTLVPAWVAITMIHYLSWKTLLFLFALIAIADTAAYFTGRAFGKTKLAPSLSPGKTREGVLGALLASGLWAALGAYWMNLDLKDWFYFIALCLVTALISVAGDLFESLLKRQAGAKDSGRILPGHGGVLDRIDSLTAAAPVFMAGLYWMFQPSGSAL